VSGTDRAARVLVTGGAGFIGSHCVDALLRKGWHVRVLDDFSSGVRNNLPLHDRLETVEADICDANAVGQAVLECQAVLHLAAQVSVAASIDAPVTSARTNIAGFLNVLDATRRAQVQRFVFASSAAVYGDAGVLPLDENSPTLPISPYGLEKLVNEQYAALYGQLYGMDTLGMRFFNVFGPRQNPRSPYAGVISKFVDAASRGEALMIRGSGAQTRDFVYVGDIAKICVAALRSTDRGVVAVGTGRSTRVIDLARAVGQAVGRVPTIQHVDALPGDIEHSAMTALLAAKMLGGAAFMPLDDGLRALVRSLADSSALVANLPHDD
jgi:UDP-glucose 4-epimerase